MTEIRLATESDLLDLPEIENQAALRLRGELPDLYALFSNYVMSAESFQSYLEAGRLWVAVEDQRTVGFIVASIIDNHAHIDEVDVLPNYGRQGIGRELIDIVMTWATEKGLSGITLSTQTNVPWNAPFYAKLGFEMMPPNQWTASYVALCQHEADLGFPMNDRVLMFHDI